MEKGMKTSKLYIFLVFILLSLLILIFFIINDHDEKKINIEKETTKATNITSKKREEDKTFKLSLREIIGSNSLSGNYKLEIKKNNAVFYFNCTNYNENNNTCLSGSGLMKINDHLFPLYTYESINEGYLDNLNDYYIMVSEDKVILVVNLNNEGIAKFYDLNGKYLYSINNIIFKYKDGDLIVNDMYPNVDNNHFYAYICEKNQVIIKEFNLDNIKLNKRIEKIKGTTCN